MAIGLGLAHNPVVALEKYLLGREMQSLGCKKPFLKYPGAAVERAFDTHLEYIAATLIREISESSMGTFVTGFLDLNASTSLEQREHPFSAADNKGPRDW